MKKKEKLNYKNSEQNITELKKYIEENLDFKYYSFFISGFILNMTYAKNLEDGKKIINNYIKEVVEKKDNEKD